MTGAELKQWRDNHKLSQADLAKHLECTRDVIGNYESGRTACPDNMAELLIVVGKLLASQPVPLAKQKPPGKRGIPSRVILNLQGVRVHPSHADRTVKGFGYYRYCWINPANGHHVFNLYVVGTDWDGAQRGVCRTAYLDVNDWRIGAEVAAHMAGTKELVDKLRSHLADEPPQSLADMISPNPVYFPEQPQSTAPPITPGMFQDPDQ